MHVDFVRVTVCLFHDDFMLLVCCRRSCASRSTSCQGWSTSTAVAWCTPTSQQTTCSS